MKGLLALAAAVLVALGAWLYVSVRVMPKQTARDFVDSIRLNLDGIEAGRFSRSSWWGPPGVASDAWEAPRYGIAEDFRLELTNPPRVWDPPESRTLVWRVAFGPSPVFKAPPRAEEETYRLVMVDSGTRLVPKYRVAEFLPWRTKRSGN